MGSNVDRLLEQALGSLTFADINAKRGIKGTTRKHIEDAKKAILRYIEADREEGIEVTIKRRTEPAFVRPKFVYEISAPGALGGTLDDGEYTLIKREEDDHA